MSAGQAIASGSSHSLAQKSDGTNWAWGDNSYYELGNGTTVGSSAPVQVDPLVTSVTTCTVGSITSPVAAGNNFSLAVKSDGTVWGWGSSYGGTLGSNATNPNLLPVQVPTLTSVTGVAAGDTHGLALKSDGTVWAWGNNTYGQLGNGNTTSSSTPVLVLSLTGVMEIGAAGNSSLALKSDGSLWQWGQDPISGSYPVSTPVRVHAELQGATAMAVAMGEVMAVKCDGTVWTWGYDRDGQLGNGTTQNQNYFGSPQRVRSLSGVTRVAAGYWSGYLSNSNGYADGHALALKSDGTVWSWGYNAYGQLGNGNTTSQQTPVQVSGLAGVTAISSYHAHSEALRSDGTVWGWGYNSSGQLGNGSYSNSSTAVQAAGLTGGVGIAAGTSHSLAHKSDGTNWAWGDNSYYELGNGITVNIATPVQVDPLVTPVTTCTVSSITSPVAAGNNFSLAVKSDGTVWAWGYSYNGQLGPNAMNPNLVSVQVATLSSVGGLAAGDSHAMALKSDGSVWAWGNNTYGQLGTGNTTNSSTPVLVSGMSGVTEIAAAGGTSLALKSDGSIWQWGVDPLYGNYPNSTPARVHPELQGVTAIAVATGEVMAIRCDGTVWTWGYDRDGQLGNGTTQFNSTFSSPQRVRSLTGATRIAAGYWSGSITNNNGNADGHALALKSDGTVWSWGYNAYGQLGNGTTTSSSVPVQATGLTGVTGISSYHGHSEALKSDGTVWGWGNGGSGQLGNGSYSNSTMPVQASSLSGASAIGGGYAHSLAQKTDGSNWAWGDNSYYELGNGITVNSATPVQVDPLVTPVTSCTVSSITSPVAAGNNFSLAVKSDGSVLSWGTTTPGGGKAPTPVPSLISVSGVTAGDSHAMALKSDGSVWAWGNNTYGQLGTGNTTNSLTPVLVSGMSGVMEIAAAGGTSLALKSDGSIWQWGVDPFSGSYPYSIPARVHPELQGVTAIAIATGEIMAIRCDGTVWTWGYDRDGQLGNGTTQFNNPFSSPQRVRSLTGMTRIAAGYWSGSITNNNGNADGHSLALKADGTVWSWGYNAYGQLGNGTTTSSSVPVQATGLIGVTAISSYHGHSEALKSDGTVWGWGNGGSGQLGNGNSSNSSTPVQAVNLTSVSAVTAGYQHTLARVVDGTNWNWGDNSYYELADGTNLNSNVPEQAGLPRIGSGPGAGASLTNAELLGSQLIDENSTSCKCSEPVDTATGNLAESFTDLAIPGRGLPLKFTRYYNSLSATQASPIGFGWTHSYNATITFDGSGNPTVHEENGASIAFTKSGSSYTAPSRVLAQLVLNGDGTFSLNRSDQTHLKFSSGGQLLNLSDRNGYPTTLGYTNGKLTSITDPAGRALNLTYTGSQITGIADVAGGRNVAFSYDASNNLTGAQDVAGNWTRFTYDSSHDLVTITDPLLNTLTNVYDAFGRVTQQTDPLQRVTAFNFSTPGVTFVTHPKGNVTEFIYQNNALLQRVDGWSSPQQTGWSYSYDLATLAITKIVDSDLNTTTYTWDSRSNQLSRTDGLGRTSNYTYSSLNDALTVRDQLGVTTTSTYDANGNLVSVARPLTGTSQTQSTTYSYDPAHAGDLASVTDPNGKIWRYVYDQYGNKVSVTDPLGNKSTFAYDGVGRLQSMVTPRGNVSGGNPSIYTWSFTFNSFGDRLSVTDPLGNRTSSTYDADRNLVTISDPNTHVSTNTYDADNELTQVTRADNSTLKKTYDANGNVTGDTDGLNHTTAYSYDSLNRPISTTDPLNRVTSSAYDAIGNLTRIIDAKGATTSYSYDGANQVVGISYSDGQTPGVSFTYDSDGQRLTMGDGTGTSSYVYDSLHRLTQSTNGAGAQVSYAYDLGGHLTAITYPGGSHQVTRTYDDSGRLATITDWLGHTTSYTYDADSNLLQTAYPNTTSATYTYDAADRLTAIGHNRSGTPFLSFGYTRDSASQLTAENGLSYGYDSINRMTSGAGLSYSYDAADRLTQIVNGSNTTAQTYDNGSQLLSSTVTNGGVQQSKLTYVFDNNGNRVSQTDLNNATTSFTYDQVNRLIGYGASASYAYNGDGLRSGKTVSAQAESFAWDTAEGLPVIIQDGTTSYVTGPGGLPLEQISSTGVVYYYHQDQLGSTRAMTDASGTVVVTYNFDGYGNLASATGSINNPFQFAGQHRDSESSLYYLRARYYEPSTGGFLTRDPVSVLHPYSYASDAPVNRADPSGLLDFGGVWNWVYNNSSTIASTAYLAAAVVAFIPGIDVLTPVLIGIAVGASLIAANRDFHHCKYAAAALDLLGALPVLGVVGRGGRAALGAAEALPDGALVVRGGLNDISRIEGGSGVSIDSAGSVHGVSVNSAPGMSAQDLASYGIKNKQIGVTSVGDIRKAGGYVRSDPIPGNPVHCVVGGLSAAALSGLLTPTIANPCA